MRSFSVAKWSDMNLDTVILFGLIRVVKFYFTYDCIIKHFKSTVSFILSYLACVKPATTASLCNHQCVVSMLQKMLPVRCNRKSSIKLLLGYQEIKWRSEIVFLILIHRNMIIITMLRYANFPQFQHSQ